MVLILQQVLALYRPSRRNNILWLPILKELIRERKDRATYDRWGDESNLDSYKPKMVYGKSKKNVKKRLEPIKVIL